MLLAFEAILTRVKPQQMPREGDENRESGQVLGLEGPMLVERPSSYCLAASVQRWVGNGVVLSFVRCSSELRKPASNQMNLSEAAPRDDEE